MNAGRRLHGCVYCLSGERHPVRVHVRLHGNQGQRLSPWQSEESEIPCTPTHYSQGQLLSPWQGEESEIPRTPTQVEVK
jgi:hypothetical protein